MTTTYRCPMHPEVQSDHPMTCSKCGMKLEPREDLKATTGSKKGRNEPIRK